MTASPQARSIAAQCWCDRRTKDVVFDPILAEVFAETIGKYLEALQWVNANKHLLDEHAMVNYEKIIEPLIQENI